MKRAPLVIDVQNEYFTGERRSLTRQGISSDPAGDGCQRGDASPRLSSSTAPGRPADLQQGKRMGPSPEMASRPQDLGSRRTSPVASPGRTGGLAATAEYPHRHDRRVHDPHVLRHDSPPGRPSRIHCGIPERRDRHPSLADPAGKVTAEELHRSILSAQQMHSQRGAALIRVDRANPSQHHESLRLPRSWKRRMAEPQEVVGMAFRGGVGCRPHGLRTPRAP